MQEEAVLVQPFLASSPPALLPVTVWPPLAFRLAARVHRGVLNLCWPFLPQPGHALAHGQGPTANDGRRGPPPRSREGQSPAVPVAHSLNHSGCPVGQQPACLASGTLPLSLKARTWLLAGRPNQHSFPLLAGLAGAGQPAGQPSFPLKDCRRASQPAAAASKAVTPGSASLD